MICNACNKPFEPSVPNQTECLQCMISPRRFNKGRIDMAKKICKDCQQPFEGLTNARFCPACKLKNDLIANATQAQESLIRADETFKFGYKGSVDVKGSQVSIPDAIGSPVIKDSSLGILAKGALAYLGVDEATFVSEGITIYLKRNHNGN